MSATSQSSLGPPAVPWAASLKWPRAVESLAPPARESAATPVDSHLLDSETPRDLAARVRSGELDLRDLLRAAPDRQSRQELIDGFGGDLRRVRLAGAKLQGLNLQGADMTACNLREANLSGCRLDGASLAFADLRRANLRSVSAIGCGFEGAWMQGAICRQGDFTGSRFDGARLQDTDFGAARMRQVSLRGAYVNRLEDGFGGTRIDSAALRRRLRLEVSGRSAGKLQR